ncbi:MAG: hypothetical protein V7K41_00990 [Nostoc sp.]
MYKLEVRDRTQATVLAIQKGLVAPELLINQIYSNFSQYIAILSGNAVVLLLDLV